MILVAALPSMWCQAPDQTTELPWVRTILNEQSRKLSKNQLLEGFTVLPLEIGDRPRINDFGSLKVARETTADFIKRGKFEDAYNYIKVYLADHHPLYGFVIDMVIDCELITGRFDEALKDLVINLQNPSAGNESKYLDLCLATSALGKVYPGQYDYSAAWLSKYYRDVHPSMSLPSTEQGRIDSKSAEITSSLALGMRGGYYSSTGFLELVLKIDPSNELAARQAIRLYKSAGIYSGVRRVAEGVASHLEPGAAKAYFVKEYEDALEKADKAPVTGRSVP